MQRAVGAQHGILIIDRRKLEALALPDGTLTLEEEAFTTAKQALDMRVYDEDEFNRNLARARATTPNRVEHLWQCLDRRLISKKGASELVKGGRITDQGWEMLRELQDDPEAPAISASEETTGSVHQKVEAKPRLNLKKVSCWTAELRTASEPIDLDFDPLAHRDKPFPWAATTRLLDDLSDDGWRLAHVSEDRGVDEGADVSFVVAARFLLAR